MKARKTKPLPAKMTFALDNILAERRLDQDIFDTICDNTPPTSSRWTQDQVTYLHEQIMEIVNAHLEALK